MVYVGRIDENKGCKELFRFFSAYLQEGAGRLTLVLIGNSILDIPSHPRIRHLGFVDDTDKFDAIAGAELLLMPSYFESLSMVALEAWALGRPVLANAKCDVLKGQCIRSNAGLYYENEREFVESLRALEHNRWIAGGLGKNGRQFYRDHYDWPVVEQKYLDMLARLSKETSGSDIEPMPGFLERRKRDIPAAATVVAGLPAGPSVHQEAYQPRTTAPLSPPLPRRPAPESRPPQPARPRRFGGPRRGGPPRHGGRR